MLAKEANSVQKGPVARSRLVERLLVAASSSSVLLVGASGAGKTTVLTECLERVPEPSATTFVCGSEPLRHVPFGALSAAVHVPQVPLLEAQLLAHLMTTLREAPSRRGPLVCVDDVHLLDAASAGVLEQLVRRGEARLLMTHSGEHSRTAWLDALVRGGWMAIEELAPLDAAGLAELTRAELGGAVDLTTIDELLELSGGNVLDAVRTLRASVQNGRLTETGATWTATGPLEEPLRDVRWLDERLASISPTAREALDLFATIDTIELDVLATVCSAPCLESLEQAELITIDSGVRRATVRLHDRAVAERVMSGATATRRRRISRGLADAIRTTGARRDTDVLRLARLDLASGRSMSAEVAVAAARQALLAHETTLARRLADVAMRSDAAFAPHLVAGQAAFASGNLGRADELLTRASELAISEREMIQATLARSAVLSVGREDSEAARDLITHVLPGLQDPRGIAELQAELSRMSLADGRWVDAEQLPVGDLAEASSSVATTTGQLTSVTQQIMAGSFAAASESADRALAFARTWSATPLMTDRLELAQADALLFAGRLAEVRELADRRLRALRRTDDTMMLGAWWLTSARVHLVTGRIDVARSSFRRSVVALERNDPLGLLCRARAYEGLGAAQAGDLPAVERSLEKVREGRGPSSYRTQVVVGRVQAWKQALEGGVAEAASSALEVGLAAMERNQFAVATVAMYDAVRFGRPKVVLDGLTELAVGFEGALSPLLAHHAARLADEDGEALDLVAHRFEEMGAMLVAAEARTNAAAAHRAQRRIAESAASQAHADLLLERCPGARTPMLSMSKQLLTPRQDQIARLATHHRNDEIAEMLHISVRTVESHLDAAYQQLGIHSREAIAAILTPE